MNRAEVHTRSLHITGNVVWLEPWQAARAMLERSDGIINTHPTRPGTSPIPDGTGTEPSGEAMEHEESSIDGVSRATGVKKDDALIPPIPVPPGVWRKGHEYPCAKGLLMRFATRADRKVKGAERLSQYYRNYGNPNFGGMKGLISSSRKRRLRGHTQGDQPADIDSKNPWGSLAEAWGSGETDERWERSLDGELCIC